MRASVFVLCATIFMPLAWCVAAEQRQVERWGIFEVELKGPAAGNPFVDVDLSAQFTIGQSTIRVNGFYDGEGRYILRFMPDAPGMYRFSTKSNAKGLEARAGIGVIAAGGNKELDGSLRGGGKQQQENSGESTKHGSSF